MSSIAETALLMARYNQWANATVRTALTSLPPSAWSEEKGAFFGSIMGTLNHVLVGDRVWLSRMTHTPYEWFTGLDQILFPEQEAFWDARTAWDEHILATIPTLPTEGSLSYVNSRGEPQVTPWPVLLTHLFNHQTHHRGQVHTLISQLGGNAPPLDLLYFRPA